MSKFQVKNTTYPSQHGRTLLTASLVTLATTVMLFSIQIPLSLAGNEQSLMEEAAVALHQGSYGKAAKLYQSVLKGSPQHRDAQLGMATCLQGQGKLDDALNSIRQITTQHPNYAPGYYHLGLILEAKGDTEGAKEAYRTYLQKNGGQIPDSPGIHIKFRKLGLI